MATVAARRVPQHTSRRINERIREDMRQRVLELANAPAGAIERRLHELEAEWDVERALEVNAATLALTGSVLGALVDRKWLALPLVVTGFLIQHGVQGWCPPLPVLRRMGFRTRAEIDRERYALMALRGDFEALDAGPGDQHGRALRALDAVGG